MRIGTALWGFLVGFWILFLGLALVSFSPVDPSLFSQTYPLLQVQNWAGLLGSSLAAGIFYYLGWTGALILVFLCHLLIRGRSYGPFLLGWALFGLSLFFLPGLSILWIQGYPVLQKGVFGESLLAVFSTYLGSIGSGVFGAFVGLCGLHLLFPFGIPQRFKQIPPPISRETPLETNEPGIQEILVTPVPVPSPPQEVPPSFAFELYPLPSFVPGPEEEATGEMILKKIQEFQISGRITGIQKSLSVTTYEFTPSPGVKQARVLALGDDLALGLGQASLMIQPIPERQALGIQLLEPNPKTLKLGSLLGSKVYQDMPPLSLPLPLGLSLYGEPLIQDLRQMPHLLISGTTGSGKSIALHSMIASLIYRLDPTQLKLILIDPKMLEFKSYQGIGHLLFPVAKDPHKALELLQWTVDEMENRYKLMEQDGARDLAFYEGRVPLILVVIDEWADLMGQLPKEMESLVQRLCQKARASGIHLILATQRPSVDVITGVIKANMPARMAFQLPSKYDSRTVLDQGGAEKLRGKGDFLFMAPGFGKTVRGQAPYLSEEEIQGLTLALRAAKV